MFGVCVKLGTFGFAAFLGYVPLGVAESARTVPAAPCVSAEACPVREGQSSSGITVTVQDLNPPDNGACHCVLADGEEPDPPVCQTKRVCSFDVRVTWSAPGATHWNTAVAGCNAIGGGASSVYSDYSSSGQCGPATWANIPVLSLHTGSPCTAGNKIGFGSASRGCDTGGCVNKDC